MSTSEDLDSLRRVLDRGRGIRVQSRRELLRLEEASHQRAETSSRRALLELGGGVAVMYLAPHILKPVAKSGISYYTDFAAPDALKAWTSFKDSLLSVEPFEGRMAARPQGLNLLSPSADMDDGEAVFRLATGQRPAKIVVRAPDDRNAYIVGVTSLSQKGRVDLTVERLGPGGRIKLAEAKVPGLRMASVGAPWLRLRMEQDRFTAFLEWDELHPLARILPAAAVPPHRAQAVLHHWRDDGIGKGAIGLMGPGTSTAVAAESFLVYSVEVNS